MKNTKKQFKSGTGSPRFNQTSGGKSKKKATAAGPAERQWGPVNGLLRRPLFEARQVLIKSDAVSRFKFAKLI